MSFRSSELLQFPELREIVAGYSGSAPGRERVLELEPSTDLQVILRNLAEAAEAIGYRSAALAADRNATPLRFDSVPDIQGALPSLRVDGVRLDSAHILDLFKTLETAAEYRGLLLKAAGDFPLLAAYGRSLADLAFISARWKPSFLPDGRLLDSASSTLARIRRDIEKQNRSIQDSLQRFLRAHRTDGSLQEDFVTVREDRYVVPIVAGYKGRVEGIIHGASGTGRTLYVEPLETVGLNNDLVRLRDDEQREIERILLEITDQLRAHHDDIATMAETLTQLDFLFAKAEFAAEFGAVVPTATRESSRFELEEARHPLLEAVLRRSGGKVVPISFDLNQERRCLLISGPNTGGKTVTLKTAGLFAVMAQAGLPVPCRAATIPVFADVLADVGDAQSIEASLSSFSGHMVQVREMLERVTPDSLILLDELGRATDPDEGGALGVAILEQFRMSGCFCLASTHLMPLKLYGARTPNVLNASMGFDDATLAPTYELRLGLPGRSAGLDIAGRMNLPTEVLTHARSVLPKLQADFEQVLQELQRQKAEGERLQADLKSQKEELEARRARLEAQALDSEQKRQREWSRKSEQLIADFEARALLTIAEVKEEAEGKKAVEKAAKNLFQVRREFAEEAETEMAPPPELAPVAEKAATIEEGTRVRLKNVREPSTVLRVLKNGRLEVQAGALRMQVGRDDVQQVIAASAAKKSPAASNAKPETGPRWTITSRELNLIGQRVDEALGQLDSFLDSAMLDEVNRVRIIHGHGMGILRKAVAEHLQGHPAVERFYAASPSEGGTGATIVELQS